MTANIEPTEFPPPPDLDFVARIEKRLAESLLLAKVKELEEKNKQLTEALESISKNTCCDKCQAAALVARKALEHKKGEGK